MFGFFKKKKKKEEEIQREYINQQIIDYLNMSGFVGLNPKEVDKMAKEIFDRRKRKWSLYWYKNMHSMLMI